MAVKRLKERGLAVVRHSGRAKILLPTAKGKDACDRFRRLVREIEQPVLRRGGFPDGS